MAIIKKDKYEKRQIDLNGQEGNAYCLLGYAYSFSKQLGFSEEKADKIQTDMKSSDYENLIKVFDDNFGSFVDLVRWFDYTSIIPTNTEIKKWIIQLKKKSNTVI